MKNTHKGFSTPLVIAIIVVAVIGIVFLTTRTRNSGSAPKNTNRTVTNSSPTTGWKPFTNREIGVGFKYPPTWGPIKTQKIDATMNVNQTGALVSHGRAFIVSFQNSGVIIQASSKDFEQFMSTYYDGGEDLTKSCPHPGVLEASSFCSITTVVGQPTADRTFLDGAECSYGINHEVRLNLHSDPYTGLLIRDGYGLDIDCVSKNNDQVVNTELTALMTRKNLTADKLKSVQDFDTLLSTINIKK